MSAVAAPRTPARPIAAQAADRPVRVLHLIHTMAFGGVETALLNWCRAADRTGVVPHLACFSNPGGGGTEAPFVEAAERLGLTVHKVPWGRRKPVLSAAREAARLCRELRVDVLHSHNWYADYTAAVAGRLAPVKTITTLYVWHDYGFKRNVLQKVDEFAIRFLDRITAHCEATRRATLARGFRPERVGTLICGFESRLRHLPAEERADCRRRRGVAEDEFLFVNVARLYPEKAHDALLRCFRRVADAMPSARLHILGIGPLEAELKALCTRLGLDDRVRFIGFEPDLSEAMGVADVQLHPAHIEGVPLALCEGMAAALPIVASDVGGVSEVIKHGRTGVLVPAGDEDGFVAAALALAGDPRRREALGREARRFIQDDYSLARAVAEVETCYRELLGWPATAS